MRYAKLINGHPVYAPNPIKHNGLWYGNPPGSVYEAEGYKPVSLTDQPEPPGVGWWVETWTETEEAIEQCIVEALNGVNIVGIGTMQYNRYAFPDAGSRAYHDDGLHVYRILTMSATWAESEQEQL